MGAPPMEAPITAARTVGPQSAPHDSVRGAGRGTALGGARCRRARLSGRRADREQVIRVGHARRCERTGASRTVENWRSNHQVAATHSSSAVRWRLDAEACLRAGGSIVVPLTDHVSRPLPPRCRRWRCEGMRRRLTCTERDEMPVGRRRVRGTRAGCLHGGTGAHEGGGTQARLAGYRGLGSDLAADPDASRWWWARIQGSRTTTNGSRLPPVAPGEVGVGAEPGEGDVDGCRDMRDVSECG